MCNLLFYTRHQWLGASSRYRSIQFFPFLRDMGYAITHRPFFSDEYLRRRSSGKFTLFYTIYSFFRRGVSLLVDLRQADIVIIEKEVFPYLPAWSESLLRLSGKPLIYDYDDAIWHTYERLKPGYFRSILSCKIEKLVSEANHVITGSHYLAAKCSEWGSAAVTLIPTTVPQSRYLGQGLNCEKSADIVWIGSMSTGQYLIPLLPVLVKLNEKFGTTVRLIGFPEQHFESLPSFFTILPWDPETEIAYLASSRIGIMPLPDDDYERGKCGFKLIQYMGVGIPVVASPVGENCFIVHSGVNGFLASSIDDWYKTLCQLLGDQALMDKLASSGYELFKKKYSTESAALKYQSILQDVANIKKK